MNQDKSREEAHKLDEYERRQEWPKLHGEAEARSRPSLKIRCLKAKSKRNTWITDLDDLNYLVDICKKVVAQPDKFNLQMLETAIRQAEGEDEP